MVLDEIILVGMYFSQIFYLWYGQRYIQVWKKDCDKMGIKMTNIIIQQIIFDLKISQVGGAIGEMDLPPCVWYYACIFFCYYDLYMLLII